MSRDQPLCQCSNKPYVHTPDGEPRGQSSLTWGRGQHLQTGRSEARMGDLMQGPIGSVAEG